MHANCDIVAEIRKLMRQNPRWGRASNEPPRRPVSAAERVETYLAQCHEADRRQTAEAQALKDILAQVEVALVVLGGPNARRPLQLAIDQQRKDAAGCCDPPTVGGHSHTRHAAVRLRARWDRFPAGTRLTLPESLAWGLKVGGFGDTVGK